MHPAISLLASQVGVQIADRSCADAHVFDGQTIATHYHRMHWVETGKKDKWGYPEEICVRTEGGPIFLTDHDLLHEIMHYAAAAPEQKDLPEFGLGYIGVYNQAPVSGVVDHWESELQEKTTQFLCCFFGSHFGLDCGLVEQPDFMACNSWEDYFIFKREENSSRYEVAIERAIRVIQSLGY